MYGEGAVTDQMCQKWFVKFCAGDFSLDDAPWSDRPVKVDQNQIETLIESNWRYTMEEVANTLIIFKPVIGEHWKCVFYFTKPPHKTKWIFLPTQEKDLVQDPLHLTLNTQFLWFFKSHTQKELIRKIGPDTGSQTYDTYARMLFTNKMCFQSKFYMTM